jgi:hypothetical protein
MLWLARNGSLPREAAKLETVDYGPYAGHRPLPLYTHHARRAAHLDSAAREIREPQRESQWRALCKNRARHEIDPGHADVARNSAAALELYRKRSVESLCSATGHAVSTRLAWRTKIIMEEEGMSRMSDMSCSF